RGGGPPVAGPVTQRAPASPGGPMGAETLEGELAIMNRGGTAGGPPRLSRPAIALEIDPLGRYVIYGHSTGEIVRLDFFGPDAGSARSAPVEGERLAVARSATTRTSTGSVRRPDWTVPAVGSEPQAGTAGRAGNRRLRGV